MARVLLPSLFLLFLFSHAASAPTFQCTAGSFTLTVEAEQPSSTFNYTVYSAVTSQPWLEGGGLAILSNGTYLIPGAGLTPTGPAQLGSGEDDLGPYTYCALPWTTTTTGPQGGTPFVTNFSCYEEHIGFTLHFPVGYNPSTPAQTALPATHFPQFKVTASTLSSPTMSYVEWAGEMDTYGNQHGVGLQGYKGGVESGPLLLFNNSQLVLGGSVPQACVLGPGGGPGTHVAHGVLRVVRDPSSSSSSSSSFAPPCSSSGGDDLACYYAPHTDKVGGDSSPGTAGGVLVAAGNASACCAACAALGGALCDSWVYDTDGTAGGSNCWPLLGTTGSKQGMGDRDFGLAPSAAPPCGTPTLDSTPATFTPSPGWEAGVGASTPASCCRLCGTLGAGACTSWVLLPPNASSITTSSGGGGGGGLCIPLLNASTALKPAPGALYGAIQALPSVLAAGVQGRIALFPPRFSSVWWLAAGSGGSGSGSGGGGVNDAVMAYGWALRKVAGLQRLEKALDPMRNLLSYWSDNGAYYFDGTGPSSSMPPPTLRRTCS